jgi:hypothetical protein
LATVVAAVLWRSERSSRWLVSNDAEAAPAAQPRLLVLGMNLHDVSDWSREWAFVDVFQHHREWISQDLDGSTWNDKRPIDLTDAGYPLPRADQAAITLMCREVDGHYPGGTYVCTYRGKGKITFGFDARVISQKAGRIELLVRPGNGGILMRIERSDKADPIRDLHVWMPGFEDGSRTFHPLFVERLKPFRVIRFMDWGRTNNSAQAAWSDRVTPAPGSIRQSGPGGVALEHMIDLCNELKASPWFCMPHLADDDYVRHFAEIVKQLLHPDAKVYVEWSNETWNTTFDQANWVNGTRYSASSAAGSCASPRGRRRTRGCSRRSPNGLTASSTRSPAPRTSTPGGRTAPRSTRARASRKSSKAR